MHESSWIQELTSLRLRNFEKKSAAMGVSARCCSDCLTENSLFENAALEPDHPETGLALLRPECQTTRGDALARLVA